MKKEETRKSLEINTSPITHKWLVVLVSLSLAFVYLLQASSPLRLNTDSLTFLSIGASVADGHGFLFHGQPTHFPLGYPAMVAILDRIGLASSCSFIILNCIFLGITLLSSYLLYRNPLGFKASTSVGLCCFVMLSFVLVKHMTLPLSDVPFMGIFTPALLFLVRSRDEAGQIKWVFMVSAILLTALAITVRTVGVALLPAFVWWVGQSILSNLNKMRKNRPLLLQTCLIGICVSGLLCALFISKTKYFQEMKDQYFQMGLANRLQNNLYVHTTDFGELGINLPSSKVPLELKPAFTVVGMLAIALAIRGVWLRRRSLSVLEIGLMTYGGIIFIWPYQDARFWLPVIPIIVGYIALAMIDISSQRYIRLFGIAACAWFVVAGIIALIYSTRISLAGNRFPDLYGDGSLTPSYRAAFFGQTNSVVNDEAIFLLKRYDSRTKRATVRE